MESTFNAGSTTTTGKMHLKNWVISIGRFITTNIKANYLLIFLFAYTAFNKLMAFGAFNNAMAKSEVLRPYLKILVYAIPASELLVCLLLLFNRTKKIGYYASLLLLLSFTGYIVYILSNYAGKLPCTCGGVISKMSWKQHLIFNISFIALTVRAIYASNKKIS